MTGSQLRKEEALVDLRPGYLRDGRRILERPNINTKLPNSSITRIFFMSVSFTFMLAFAFISIHA